MAQEWGELVGVVGRELLCPSHQLPPSPPHLSSVSLSTAHHLLYIEYNRLYPTSLCRTRYPVTTSSFGVVMVVIGDPCAVPLQSRYRPGKGQNATGHTYTVHHMYTRRPLDRGHLVNTEDANDPDAHSWQRNDSQGTSLLLQERTASHMPSSPHPSSPQRAMEIWCGYGAPTQIRPTAPSHCRPRPGRCRRRRSGNLGSLISRSSVVRACSHTGRSVKGRARAVIANKY